MPEGNSPSPAKSAGPTYVVPATVLARSQPLLKAFEDLARQAEAFAVKVADAVRHDPAAVGPLLQQLARLPTALFPRWTLEILYLLSLRSPMHYSELQAGLPGIANRSLSLKLDELEGQGLVDRSVAADRHVSYTLTARGRAMARLSFPLVLHLNLENGLAEALGAPAGTAIQEWS